MLFVIALFLVACNENAEEGEEYPYGHYEDDKMIGDVREINKDEQIIEVDISEWEKRDRKGPGMTEEGYYYTAKITDGTTFAYEDGTEASIEALKKGQKVLVNPPRGDSFEGEANEIILLEMTYEEKYWRLLAPSDGFNIIVMYQPGERVPAEMEEPMYENVLNILEGTEHSAGAGWVPYDKDYIVDFKEELDIEEFPVILVFNKEELLFKGYSLDELYTFLENL
ncbi:hypothetical protein [Ornithinibacillus californiensis]|uniref:hypothetical protein n=1 Tax=Ornithinibacillus californiensis TaxID=161536 RepID=UPI00064DF382|nr:hypothetical protein [Ornithinibacillus californiensis]